MVVFQLREYGRRDLWMLFNEHSSNRLCGHPMQGIDAGVLLWFIEYLGKNGFSASFPQRRGHNALGKFRCRHRQGINLGGLGTEFSQNATDIFICQT